MLPPLFPHDPTKLQVKISEPIHTDGAIPISNSSISSVASLHSGALAVGASLIAIFGLVAFFAMGIVTSSPTTTSLATGGGSQNTDIGSVYGAWTDIPQNSTTGTSDTVAESDLLASLNAIIDQHEDHTFGVVVAPVGVGSQVRINDDHVFTGASTTKLLTAAAVLAGVDNGKWKLDQVAYDLAAFAKADAMPETETDPTPPNFSPTPTPTPSPTPTPKPQPVTVQQALSQMVNRSNNTAWEQLIRMVGSKNLRQYAIDLGMQDYNVNTNLVSPRDMALLLQKIYSGQLLSQPSTQLLLSYMQHTNEERMIPAAITERGNVYHKYGWLDSVVHDVGIVDNFGSPMIVVLMSEGSTSYAERIAILREMADAVEQSLAGAGSK